MSSDKKPRLRKIISGFVLWSGLIIICLISIPIGILFSIIFLIEEVMDFILKKIDNG